MTVYVVTMEVEQQDSARFYTRTVERVVGVYSSPEAIADALDAALRGIPHVALRGNGIVEETYSLHIRRTSVDSTYTHYDERAPLEVKLTGVKPHRVRTAILRATTTWIDQHRYEGLESAALTDEELDAVLYPLDTGVMP